MKLHVFTILAVMSILVITLFIRFIPNQNSTDFIQGKSEASGNKVIRELEIDLENYIPKNPKIIPPIFISDPSNEGKPAYTPPASIPPRADKSGHCVFELHVTALGKVESIISLKCSDEIFTKLTEIQLLKWQFYPKKDGNQQPQPFKYGPNKITYKLLDLDNNIIPE